VPPRKILIPLAARAAELFERARDTASRHGYRLEGDERGGTFSGSGVTGRYEVREGVLEVTPTKKPFYVSHRMIEDELRRFFA
jgi:hypothetical protein